jgi:hypothetical protein
LAIGLTIPPARKHHYAAISACSRCGARPWLTLADIACVLRERSAAKAGAQEEQEEGGGEAEQSTKPRLAAPGLRARGRWERLD